MVPSQARLLIVCAMLWLPPGGGALADPQIKPPIRGLVSMGAYRFVGKGGDPINTLEPLNAKPGIFGGLVIIAAWKQLQPTPDSEVGDNNVIDQALAEVRAYNARNPERPLAVKLRVWGGFEAPDWAMRLGGGAPITTEHNGKQRILGPFWSEAYRQAWSRLQVQLAAKYDARPLIREVSITSCMSFTAEPFFLPNEPTVANPLRTAGYTDATHRRCLEQAVADYAPWKASRLVLSLNPFYGLSRKVGDVAFTEQVMRSRRQAVGRRCVFDNHDLDADPPKTPRRDHAENGTGDRVPDVAHHTPGFRRHHQEGYFSRRELDRALAGLPRFSAGARCHAQAMGDHDRRTVIGDRIAMLNQRLMPSRYAMAVERRNRAIDY
jgi:hypothetical protein